MAAGGLASQMKETDATKKKVYVPKQLKLQTKGAALISFDLPPQVA